NYPARGIGSTTLSKLEKAAIENECSIWKIIGLLPENNIPELNKGTIIKILQFSDIIVTFQKKAIELDAYSLATLIAEKTGFLKDLYNDKSTEGLSRYENMQELLNAIQEFTISGREEGNPNFLANYMEEVSLLTDMDNDKPEDKNKVSLMTAHSAKGLEFKNVFIVGLEENLFPSNQSGQQKNPDELEEERRLFYVALTRTKENAYLSFAQQRYKWGNLEFCTPSRFISEVDEKYIDLPLPQMRQETNTGSTFGFNNRQDFINRPRPQRPVTIAGQNNFTRKLVKLQDSGNYQQFAGDDPMKIAPGLTVEHQRFGIGKVLKVEGIPPNLKATVFFQNAGQKQLLLKFAKLKIIS
ncbi:MAG: ATP-binding domain-containing protein, partial [Prolixibacteraceae bacterium]|nr:ATP-binding domain-containing protein [Prolixibacteraceae bacterium]